MVSYITEIIGWILFAYLTVTAFYNLTFTVAALWYSNSRADDSSKDHDFLVLLPAYKEDRVILESITDALKQHYPTEKFELCVIADLLNQDTLSALKSLPITVLEPHFKISSKAASINFALQRVKGNYDAVVILDADNHMDPGFLRGISDSLNAGFKAIQGHRVAKNQNTQLALLDGISEEINNTIFRKGHVALGYSSALIGSAMAFEFELYKSIMATIDSFAEDKELELKLMEQGVKIEYRHDLLVYDEKVQRPKEFVNQRKRWVSYQLHYARIYMLKSIKLFFTRGNVDFLDKVIQQVFPPRIILLFLPFVGLIFSALFASQKIFISWTGLFMIVCFSTALAIPRRFYSIKTLKAISYLPVVFLMMILSTLLPKRNKHEFGATPHYYTKEKKSTHDNHNSL